MKKNNYRRGIVRSTDSDGDAALFGWGFDLFMKQVVWTSESALNTTCGLFETKEEATEYLVNRYQDEIELTEAKIKHLKRAVDKLTSSKIQVTRGNSATVGLMHAVYDAEVDAEVEINRKRRVKKLKKEFKKEMRELKGVGRER